MTSRKIFNFESKILIEETIKKYGYDPNLFGNASSKFVLAICRFCGKQSDIRKGFFIKSGSACHKECRLKEQSLSGSPFNKQEVRDKAKQTNLTKYGSEFASQNKEIAQKISDTKLTNESKEKTKKTNLERYGVENIFQSEDIKEQIKQINIEKFGVSSPLQNEEIKAKMKQTCLHKHGKENPMQNADVQERSRTTNLEKYGTDNPIQNTNIRQKQNEVKKSLEKFGIVCNFNDRSVISPLGLDIHIPEHNFAIEFNGSYWHSEAVLESVVARNKHIGKTKICRSNNIRLFHIFEKQWENRQPQILNFIKSILGLNTAKIAARKCSITNDCSQNFLEANHIQGKASLVRQYFNLVYNGEIVASMTASKHHRQNVEGNPIVLSRLCFKDGVNVQGGSSKLFSAFVEWSKSQGYDKVLSWSDNCWTEGNIYKVLGFELVKEYGPDYFYWNSKNNQYLSKQSQKKSNTGCPESMTEREWCYQNGLFRIWDCGKRLWSFSLV